MFESSVIFDYSLAGTKLVLTLVRFESSVIFDYSLAYLL